MALYDSRVSFISTKSHWHVTQTKPRRMSKLAAQFPSHLSNCRCLVMERACTQWGISALVGVRVAKRWHKRRKKKKALNEISVIKQNGGDQYFVSLQEKQC